MACQFHLQSLTHKSLATLAGQTLPLAASENTVTQAAARADFWKEQLEKRGHILVLAESCLSKFGFLEGATAFIENVWSLDQYYTQISKLKNIFSLGGQRMVPRLKELFGQYPVARSLIMQTLAQILPPAELENFLFQTAFPLVFNKENISMEEQFSFMEVVAQEIPTQTNHQLLLNITNLIYDTAQNQLDRNRATTLRQVIVQSAHDNQYALDYQKADRGFLKINQQGVIAESEVYRLWQEKKPLALESETKVRRAFHLMRFALEQGMTDLTKFDDSDFISLFASNNNYYWRNPDYLFLEKKVLPFLKTDPARYLKITKELLLMQLNDSSSFKDTSAYFLLWHAPDTLAARQLFFDLQNQVTFQKRKCAFLTKDSVEVDILKLHWSEKETSNNNSLLKEGSSIIRQLKEQPRKRENFPALIAQSATLLRSLELDFASNLQTCSGDLLHWAWETVNCETEQSINWGGKLLPAMTAVIQNKAKDYHAYQIPHTPALFEEWYRYFAAPEHRKERNLFLKRYGSITEKHDFTPDQQQKVKLLLEDLWRQEQPDLPYYTNDTSGLMDLVVEVGDQQTLQLLKKQAHHPVQRGEVMLIARLNKKIKQQTS